MNAILPSISERLHLLRFAANALSLSLFNLYTRSRYLPIGIEFDAVRRININALHLPAQMLALGEARHHKQAVAEDHAVRPMLVVLVEFKLGFRIVEPIEIRKQIGRVALLRCAHLRTADKIVNNRLGMHLFLDEELGCLDNEVGPVLPVLATPDQLSTTDLDLAFVLQLPHLIR